MLSHYRSPGAYGRAPPRISKNLKVGKDPKENLLLQWLMFVGMVTHSISAHTFPATMNNASLEN